MRRRPRAEDLVEPPGRLLGYEPAVRPPTVDPAGHEPDRWRNIRNVAPYGEPHLTAHDWREQEPPLTGAPPVL